MSRHSLTLSLSMTLGVLGGCTAVGSGYGPPPSNTPTQQITTPPIAADAGTPGYIVTATATGVRLTWAGPYQFRGSLFASAFSPPVTGCSDGSCALNSGDVVKVQDTGLTDGTGRIDFEGNPAAGMRSGFDVALTVNTIMLIDLLVQDQRQPQLVLLSAISPQLTNTPASTLPLGIEVVPASTN